MTTSPRLNRLVSDSRRAWVSLAVTMLLTTVTSFGAGLVLGERAMGDAFWSFQMVNLLTVYCVYFACYTVLTLRVFRDLEGDALREALRASTPRDRAARMSRALSGGGATSWSVSAALTALGVAVLIAFSPDLRQDPFVLGLTGLMVAGSWLQLPVSYAVQYLRDDVDGGGLEFPGESDFRFGDYFYLAVQVTTTFATSDVAVRQARMRRRVTVHSLVAFLFNSVIIALVVSALLIAAPTAQ